MGNPLDLIGQKFNRLIVISDAGSNKHKKRLYLCRCDCGKEKIVIGSSLVSGNTGSCSCYKYEQAKAGIVKAVTTHGLSNHPLYTVRTDMIRRCYYPLDTNYKNYGGRCISICEEWLTDFKKFYDWAMQNGWRKGLQIDRFPDNNGNYNPNNCRITTSKINNNNRRNNVKATIDGVTKTASEWADITGINKSCISNRIKKGITGKLAVFGVGSGNKF